MGNYSGNHPRYSKKGDEKYDAHEAYNKDLTASARLHYFENERHDKTHPGKQVVRTGNDLSENVEVLDVYLFSIKNQKNNFMNMAIWYKYF